jgi:hypothetical protein
MWSKRLVCGKASQARITTKAWLLEPGGGLALEDDLVATAEAAATMVKMEGSTHSCS